jgi:hypothetical protein
VVVVMMTVMQQAVLHNDTNAGHATNIKYEFPATQKISNSDFP